jgi:CheY-like chemotaxis protein
MKNKVLIVEDEIIVAMQLKRRLTASGYAVDELVTSGEEAIQAVRANPPDIIVMDRGLGGKMDGLEAAQQIRAFSPVPILFMTGYNDTGLKAQIAALRPSVHLTKPVNSQEIQDTIAQLLDLK